MRRLFSAAILVLLLAPSLALASTVRTERNLVVSQPIPDNAYLAGTDVNVTVPLPGDMLAAGGTLTVSGTVAGDAMLAGGTIDIARPVAGDVRAVGGRITVEGPVTGDLVLAGGQITVSGTASSTRIAGGKVVLTGGATGPVIVYGADVTLGGTYTGDVEVIASDKLTLQDGTHIKGTLKYNAPQEAGIPPTAVVDGGVTYTGASTYLPTTEEAKRFAIAGAGVFLVVKVIAAMIAAGLLAGLFPQFTMRVVDRTLARSPRKFVLLALLGFAAVVATPFLILLLALSFVGLAVAVVLALLYVLLLILGYLCAGIIAGAALARGVFKRPGVTWRGAVIGTIVLYLIGLIPTIGPLVTLVLAATAMGAILVILYRFAFVHIEDTDL
ncbi:MAG: polymer-forming cytoskeletal protein [Patescibacteria group bacterium]